MWALIDLPPQDDGPESDDFLVIMDKVLRTIQIQFTIIVGLHWEILKIKLLQLVLGVHLTSK